MTTPPTPLHPKLPLGLPQIIHKAKKRTLPPGLLPNTLNRLLLLLLSRHRHPIHTPLMRPSRFQIKRLALPGTHLSQIGERTGDEIPRRVGADVRVEERVDIGGHDVEGGAERGGVGGEDGDGLRGGEGGVAASGAEGIFRFGDEVREGGGGGVAVEEGLVADDDHFHDAVVAREVGGDVVDLAGGGGDAGGGDEDAEDEFEVVGAGGGGDDGQAFAVGAVEADGAEAFSGDGADVGGDGGGVFAGAAVREG